MRIFMLIGLGSFIGGVGRYYLTILLQNRFITSIPYGTLAVNVIGCFLIGMIYGLSERVTLNGEWQLFLTTGILGGFTTFSSFSYETISLFRDQQYGYALLNIGISILLGLAATMVGIIIAKSI